MFTGIIEAVGSIAAATANGDGMRLIVHPGALDVADIAIGDSVAVNGACLTVVALGGGHMEFDVSAETLACTAGFAQGTAVNLEKALRFGDRLGGHLVSGHVDGVATVTRIERDGDNRLLTIAAPQTLACYIARKGSVTVAGVSLTVNRVAGNEFDVNLIPHTLTATRFGGLTAGARVNLEVDLLARYVERLTQTETQR
jgi:riboflavin synthase